MTNTGWSIEALLTEAHRAQDNKEFLTGTQIELLAEEQRQAAMIFERKRILANGRGNASNQTRGTGPKEEAPPEKEKQIRRSGILVAAG